MTLEMQQSLERELNSAVRSPDDAGKAGRINQAQCNILIALMDCQRKTADRVKSLTWKVFALVFAGGSGAGAVLAHLDKIKSFFGN